MENKLLTVKELAEYYNVTPLTIYRWKANGMPHEKIGTSGRSLRFELDKVRAWMKVKQK